MKEVRIIFSGNEYESLKNAADIRGITVKQLAHDRAIGVVPEDAPLSAAQILADEIAAYREVLNQIIKRETTADIRLYEDDVIRLEMSMRELESIVAAFISKMIRRVNDHGNVTV